MASHRTANPRLGIYYGILASAFVSLVLLLALSEQLGVDQFYLSQFMIFAPLALFAAVAFFTRTLDRREFHNVDRRVPPIFSGLALAAVAIGGIGYFAVTGALLFLGFDGLAIVLGWTLGMFAAAILFLPYLRKAGAYTLPGYFGQRFGSPEMRWLAALCVLPPLWLLFVAELKIAALAASLFASLSYEAALIVIAAIVAICVALGGLRSVTWSGCAQLLVAMIGFGVPLAVAAVLVTNLPVPQLTYAELFDRIASFEATLAGGALPPSIAQALPGDDLRTISRPFLEPFLSLSAGQFIALMLCFGMGIAGLPSVLMRAGTTRTVFDQRKAAAWGLLIVALFAVTVPAYAAFVKFGVMEALSTAESGEPAWLPALEDADLAGAEDANGDGVLSISELGLARDGVTLALPIVSGFPFVITLLVAISGIAIAMAAAAAHLFAMAAALSEDLYGVIADPAASPGRRLLMARLFALAGAAMGLASLTAFDIDVLRAACWAMSMAAATFFPVLLMSIWWARLTWLGAIAAMLVGAIVTGLIIVAGETIGGGSFLGIETLIAGLFGVPLAFLAGIGVSLASGAPAAAEQLYVEDMRHPGGETLYDRATRRATRTA